VDSLPEFSHLGGMSAIPRGLYFYLGMGNSGCREFGPGTLFRIFCGGRTWPGGEARLEIDPGIINFTSPARFIRRYRWRPGGEGRFDLSWRLFFGPNSQKPFEGGPCRGGCSSFGGGACPQKPRRGGRLELSRSKTARGPLIELRPEVERGLIAAFGGSIPRGRGKNFSLRTVGTRLGRAACGDGPSHNQDVGPIIFSLFG